MLAVILVSRDPTSKIYWCIIGVLSVGTHKALYWAFLNWWSCFGSINWNGSGNGSESGSFFIIRLKYSALGLQYRSMRLGMTECNLMLILILGDFYAMERAFGFFNCRLLLIIWPAIGVADRARWFWMAARRGETTPMDRAMYGINTSFRGSRLALMLFSKFGHAVRGEKRLGWSWRAGPRVRIPTESNCRFAIIARILRSPNFQVCSPFKFKSATVIIEQMDRFHFSATLGSMGQAFEPPRDSYKFVMWSVVFEVASRKRK